MKLKTKLPGSDEIEEAVRKLSSRHFSRLINFCDIINRYIDIVFKDRVDWLKATALIVIVYIGKGSIQPNELARNLLRSYQSITKLTNALEKDGSIIRERFDEDRRAINLRITSLGLSYVMECLKDIDIADEMLRSFLDESEMETFFALTRKVRRGAIIAVGNKIGKGVKSKEQINASSLPSAKK